MAKHLLFHQVQITDTRIDMVNGKRPYWKSYPKTERNLKRLSYFYSCMARVHPGYIHLFYDLENLQ